jgi:hypothetical protein
MGHETAGPLSYEQRLAYEGMKATHVGNPFTSYGDLKAAIGDVGRTRVRALRAFRGVGLDVTPGMTVSMPKDIAKGLAQTGFAEILKD